VCGGLPDNRCQGQAGPSGPDDFRDRNGLLAWVGLTWNAVAVRGRNLVKGQECLARSDWARARACFEDALAREETAEALEGLGQAAFWLEDAAAVFEAREQAYRLYQRRRDRRGAGRVAMALADDHLSFRDEPAVAKGWLQRADRLLGGLPPIPEQGWLLLWRGYLALVLGEEPALVRQAGAEGAAFGARIGDVDLEMTGLALEGLALIIQGELAEGMPRLDEATAAVVSGEMTDPIAIGRSSCLLVQACEAVRDFERAAQWCHRIKAFSLRMRLGFPLAVCRTHYAHVLTWRGSWAEAEAELKAALEAPVAVRPALQQEAIASLADLRRLQGRFDEAAALLLEIESHPLSIVGRAALALDRSEPADAAHLAHRFLRLLPARNRTDRMAALDVLLRAQIALGKRQEARATLAALEEIAGRVGTQPMAASALLAGGLLAAADGAHARARAAFEDAIEHFRRSGASFELARCRFELGRSLAALGERDAADAELHEAAQVFERLGSGRYLEASAALRRELHQAAVEPGTGGKASTSRLTRREIEVLRLVAEGLSNQKIAECLVVSEFTVKRHVANLLAKLSLPSRAAAAAHAAREGLLA
jgi:LuxR family maltose regulon positive regulatory protein